MIRSQKNGFVHDPFLEKLIFWWSVLKKQLFSKSFFPQKVSARKRWKKGLKKTKKCSENRSKDLSKNQGQKSSPKKLGQKAKPSPTKNGFKFQNNNLKNGASARGASVVVWNLYRFVVGLGLAFWPSFFGLDFCPWFFEIDFWIDFLRNCCFFQTFFEILLAETFCGKTDFVKSVFFQNRFFQNRFVRPKSAKIGTYF